MLYIAYWESPLGVGKCFLGEHRGLGDAKTPRNDVFDHPKVSWIPPDPSRDIRRRRTDNQNKDKPRFIGPILVFFQKSRQNSSRGSQSCLVSMGYHQKCSKTLDPVLERLLEFHGCEALFHCILRFVHLNKSLK